MQDRINPLRWLALLAAFVICACGAQPNVDELGELEQPLAGNVHVPYGEVSHALGWTQVAGTPYNGACLGPDVGAYTCWVPYPSWLVSDGAGWWNNWRYFDPTNFNTVAASFNSWLGFNAGSNGLADAWAVAEAENGSMTMSYENPAGDDHYTIYAALNQNLAGVAATNQQLSIQNSIKYACLEDGGTLADGGHPATFKYCRLGMWEIDTGTLGAWIGANCTTTTCKRNAVKKIMAIIFFVSQGAPKDGAISNTSLTSPWISVGGPPASMTVPANAQCLLDHFSYGTDLTSVTQFEACD